MQNMQFVIWSRSRLVILRRRQTRPSFDLVIHVGIVFISELRHVPTWLNYNGNALIRSVPFHSVQMRQTDNQAVFQAFKSLVQIDCPRRESYGRNARYYPMQLARASISTVRRHPSASPACRGTPAATRTCFWPRRLRGPG
jgi:hypothetical protein